MPTPNINNPSDLKVADLIDSVSGEWNVDILQAPFIEQEVSLIQEIPLSNRRLRDDVYWWPTSDGFILPSQVTRSVVWVTFADGRNGLVELAAVYGRQLGVFLALQVEPLSLESMYQFSCHFFWPSKDRHVTEDGMCTLCGFEQESIIHALVACPKIQNVWERSPFSTAIMDALKTNFMSFFGDLMNKLSKAC